jgi:hypothetical protein
MTNSTTTTQTSQLETRSNLSAVELPSCQGAELNGERCESEADDQLFEVVIDVGRYAGNHFMLCAGCAEAWTAEPSEHDLPDASKTRSAHYATEETA